MAACLSTALLAPTACGQELGVYLSATWNSSSGDTYAYAQTASDYATGYWYFLCTGLVAFGQEPDYGLDDWDDYEGPSGCDSTDAEVDWSFTTDATTNYLQVFSDHYEYIEYQTYQQDPYCGFDDLDCYSYWDDFELSLVADDGEYSSPEFWYLPGPPAITYGTETLMQELLLQFGTYCFYPTAETSIYHGIDETVFPDYYSATYYATLYPGAPADYSSRSIAESIDLTSEDCSDYGGGYEAITNENFSCCEYDWTASGTEYAFDDWDYVDIKKDRADYYQTVLEGSPCTAFYGSQSMKIASCAEPTVPFYIYDTGHPIWLEVSASSINTGRGTDGGYAQES